MTYYPARTNTLHIAKFAARHPGWHTYYPDQATVAVICAAHNLGLIKVNEHDQFIGRPEALERYIASKEMS